MQYIKTRNEISETLKSSLEQKYPGLTEVPLKLYTDWYVRENLFLPDDGTFSGFCQLPETLRERLFRGDEITPEESELVTSVAQKEIEYFYREDADYIAVKTLLLAIESLNQRLLVAEQTVAQLKSLSRENQGERITQLDNKIKSLLATLNITL